MSDAHEYVTEITVSNDVWRTGISQRQTETTRSAATFTGTPGIRVVERAISSGQFAGVVATPMIERAVSRGTFAGMRDLSLGITERTKSSGAFTGTRGLAIVESAKASGQFKGTPVARITESAKASSQMRLGIGAATTERTRSKGTFASAVTAYITESARANEHWRGLSGVLIRITEKTIAKDHIQGNAAITIRLTESAKARDVIWGVSGATLRLTETAYARDMWRSIGEAPQGYAWTAHTTGWAMSRYDRYPFDSIVVCDGQAFASGDGGVWALAGGGEVIDARLTTGKMDVGRGMLVHPTQAFMEYELSGTANMTVTQTQSGAQAQSWTYPLAGEPAAHLTNGRFIFGRGLRGRHFTFDLRLNGERAHINDLYVTADATKRRI